MIQKWNEFKLIYNKGLKIYIVNVFIQKIEFKLYDNDEHIINNYYNVKRLIEIGRYAMIYDLIT